MLASVYLFNNFFIGLELGESTVGPKARAIKNKIKLVTINLALIEIGNKVAKTFYLSLIPQHI